MDIGDYVNAVGGPMAQSLGLDWNYVDAGKIYLERSDSNFYAKDLQLRPVNTLERRRALIKALLTDFVLKRTLSGRRYTNTTHAIFYPPIYLDMPEHLLSKL